MRLHIYTLGSPVIVVGERTVDPSAKVLFAGLLLFALDSGRAWARDEVGNLLWPEATALQRTARLRWLLNRFKTIGVPFEASATRVSVPAWAVAADYRTLDESGPTSIGPVLAGYCPSFSRPFARWIDSKRESICSEVVRQLMRGLRAARAAGRLDETMQLADAIQRVDPLNEEATLTIAELTCRTGQKARSLQVLDSYLEAIGDERQELQLPAKLLQRRIGVTDAAPGDPQEVRFIGHTDALERVMDTLSGVAKGSGGGLLLAGTIGIGKTRLLDEAASRLAATAIRIVRVGCNRHEVDEPVAMLSALAAKLLTLRGAVGASPRHFDRLTKLAALGGRIHEIPARDLSGALSRGMDDAILDVLEAVSSDSAVAIIVDNVQWASPRLASLWERMCMWAEARPVAIILALRTPAAIQTALRIPVVVLTALGRAGASAFVDALLATIGRPMDAGARDALLARGGGNPLFLRELIRQWAHCGSLDSTPAFLVGVLDAPIAVLSQPARRVLEIAAILGAHATLERIEVVMQAQRSFFVDAIAELETAGMLAVDARGKVFGHAIWSDVVFRSVSDSVARVLHRHAAESYEAELAAQPSLRAVSEAARHWKGAGYAERAHSSTRSGAARLWERGFPDEAAAAYADAAREAQTPVDHLRLLRERIEMLMTCGRLKEAGDEIVRHENLAAQVNPAHDRHNDLEMIQLWIRHVQNGEGESVMRSAMACAREVRAASSHRLRAAREAATMAGLIEPRMLEEVRALTAGVLPKTHDERWNRDRVEWEYHMAVGDAQLAVAVAEQTLCDQRERGNRRCTAIAMSLAASAYELVGRTGDARAILDEAVRFTRDFGLLDCETVAWEQAVALSLDLDKPATTRALIAEAKRRVRQVEPRTGPVPGGSFRNYEAQLHLAEGSPAAALRLVTPLGQSLNCNVSKWRARLLAIHVAARRALGSAPPGDLSVRLEDCFCDKQRWMDWPAIVCMWEVQAARGCVASAEFALRYIRQVRREIGAPPPELLEMGRRTDNAIPFERGQLGVHANIGRQRGLSASTPNSYPTEVHRIIQSGLE